MHVCVCVRARKRSGQEGRGVERARVQVPTRIQICASNKLAQSFDGVAKYAVNARERGRALAQVVCAWVRAEGRRVGGGGRGKLEQDELEND